MDFLFIKDYIIRNSLQYLASQVSSTALAVIPVATRKWGGSAPGQAGNELIGRALTAAALQRLTIRTWLTHESRVFRSCSTRHPPPLRALDTQCC